jgi:hypothetical protein
MKLATKICALCRQEAELQRSHLIPRAIYLDLRTPELPNPNPIVGTPKETGQRQEQIVAPLLCHSCEHRLSVNGEKWVLENGYRLNGPSRLYQTLKNAKPSSGTIYAGADLPDLDMDKLAYFGASIFWRASLRVWPREKPRGKAESFLHLGPYAEQLRLFLLGEGEFPLDMALWCAVIRTPEPPPVVSFPVGQLTSEGGESFHMHTFDIPGLSYLLFVGRHVPKRKRERCMIRSSRRVLFFTPIEDVINRKTAQFFRKSLPDSLLRKLYRNMTGEEY